MSNPTPYPKRGFLQNFFGIKYLIYDPFKKEREVNTYSWKANNGFKLRELIPARDVGFEDEKEINYIVEEVVDNDYRFRTVIEQIVLSPSFSKKEPKKR